MFKRQEIGSEKYVFLVDVSSLCPPSHFERKSAINSHAAKRMHLKRRQSRKEQLRRNEISILTWQGLAPRGQINGNRSWWTDTDSPNTDVAIKNQGGQPLTNSGPTILTSFASIHYSVSRPQENDLDTKVASWQNSAKRRPMIKSEGCLEALELPQHCCRNCCEYQRYRGRPLTHEDSDTQSTHDCAFEVRTNFNKNCDCHLGSESICLTDCSAGFIQAEKIASTPISLLGPGLPTLSSFACTGDDYKLFYFFHHTVAEIVYGYGPAAPLSYLRLVTHQFVHDEAVMHLVLAFSSYAWPSLTGKDKTCEKKGLMHKIKGMELVIKKLGQPQSSTSDSTIHAAIILSAIEGRAGNIEGLKTHLSGARLMVKMRGGLDKLSPLLLWQICSSEPRIFETAGVEMFPCTDRHFGSFLLRCRPDVAMRHAAFRRTSLSTKERAEEVLEFFEPLDLPPNLYLSACVTEFLLVMKQFRELSEARSQFLTNEDGQFRSQYSSARCTSVSNALHSPLHSILNPGGILLEPCNIDQNTAAAALYKYDTTRLVCLLYIHATLWRYRHEPAQTDTYVQLLLRDIRRNGLELSKSLDALNWVLVWLCLSDQHLKADNNNEMGWKELTRLVLRLTRVTRRLSNQCQRNLEIAMFEGLVGQQQSSMVGDLDSIQQLDATTEDCRWPDPEAVRKEFIGESP